VLDCLVEIAEYYDVPPTIVMAVYKTENGKVGEKVGPNKNGTYDLGPMQINTWWWNDHELSLDELNISQESVLNDFCQNIAVGTYILSTNYRSYGNWADAITAYNLGKPTEKISSYLRKVLENLEGVTAPK
jgi:soluble lytic murein transglycosylase-like protein